MKNRLTLFISLGMVLGVLAGWLGHRAADPKAVADGYAILTDLFLRLIKMIIAPLVFSTLVSGLAGMSGGRDIGRIGMRSFAWFIGASLVSLALGLVLANALRPGAGLHLVAGAAAVSTGLNTSGLNVCDVVTHIVPTSLLDAMARNDILQIVVFSLFFGLGLNALKGHPAVDAFIRLVDGLVPVMLRLAGYVMCFAPLGVFGALASAVTLKGLDVLLTYGRLLSAFYIGLAVLWAVLVGVGYAFLGKRIVALLRAVREPALIAFSTASSEAAFPRLNETLEAFGVDKKVVGFTLPLGYAFNLDGSMMYQAFAIMFIAQAYNIELSFTQQLLILLTLMVTSKGMAGVARASVVVVAATLPMFNLPEAGLLLIIGIDQFLDMARTATNVVGNSIATAVVARAELAHEAEEGRDELPDAPSVALARTSTATV